MVIYKDFGDTIRRGEEVKVYACILEKEEGGVERENPELSRQIRILSEDETFIINEEQELNGVYKAAKVKINTDKARNKTEGIISFIFSGRGGSFTNRMKFKIAGLEIWFGQESLAIPHDLNEPVKPWFVINGMTSETDITEVIIEPENAYQVNITEAEDVRVEGAAAFYTNLIPLNGAPSMEEREPGAFETYTLTVRVKDREGNTAEDTLPIFRVRTGLTLTTKHVDCFFYKEVVTETGDGGHLWFKDKNIALAETEAELKLIIYDVDEHRVRVVAPLLIPESVKWTTPDPKEQAMIDKIAIQIDCGEEPVFGQEGGLKVVLRVTKGCLDAPRRIKAKLKLEAEAFGKRYMAVQDILLCSQPNRSALSEAELEAAWKEDEKNGKQLTYLKNRIYNECYINLVPLHRMIEDMLDSYDLEYGYDRSQMAKIINAYNRFQRGLTVGANAKPEGGETIFDYAVWVIDSMGKAADDLESKVGFWGRLGLGVATAGLSEVALPPWIL